MKWPQAMVHGFVLAAVTQQAHRDRRWSHGVLDELRMEVDRVLDGLLARPRAELVRWLREMTAALRPTLAEEARQTLGKTVDRRLIEMLSRVGSGQRARDELALVSELCRYATDIPESSGSW